MKIELKDGTIIASGAISNIKMKKIGEKQTPLAEFSIIYGKGENGENLFYNAKCFKPLFDVVATIPKGKSVFVAGKKETREYNGKEYASIMIDFITVSNGFGEIVNKYEKIETKAEEKVIEKKETIALDDDNLPF
ncbi:MAG: single-stranded DNA-binding protein [Clostridia bacterium]|nr:single-stranded DNA-binding protein [Clostridia bacterium]